MLEGIMNRNRWYVTEHATNRFIERISLMSIVRARRIINSLSWMADTDLEFINGSIEYWVEGLEGVRFVVAPEFAQNNAFHIKTNEPVLVTVYTDEMFNESLCHQFLSTIEPLKGKHDDI